jgi:hypothetical protein
MYIKFNRVVDPETALELAQGIIKTAAQAVIDEKNINGIRSEFSDRGIIYRPDKLSGKNEVVFHKEDTIILFGDAGFGWHTLTINVGNGELTVTHDGRRRSYPGNAENLLPKIWQEINDIKDWNLMESQSSQPKWAIMAGFLVGTQGYGPSNLEEADQAFADQALSKLVEKLETSGREIPEGLSAKMMDNQIKFTINEDGWEKEYIPPF